MTLAELAQRAQANNISLGSLAVEIESEESGDSKTLVAERAERMLSVMKDAVSKGLSQPQKRSRSGLSGGDASKVQSRVIAGTCLGGNSLLARAIAYSLAVSEVNAMMGTIVAAPTAGSCGVIPGTFLALAEIDHIDDERLVDALCTAGLVGQVIADKASLSGAECGCQAECGAAAAMAAAGLTQLGGGSPEDCIHGAALALKGLLGLVCDPVCGLVEVPCVKRNATSAAVALSAAEMALAGVRSRIPPDEVIVSMFEVGRLMSPTLKETALGGLAATPTGKALCGEVHDAEKPGH